MSVRTAVKAGLDYIEGIPTLEFRLAVVICIVIGAFNALFVTYRIGYLDGRVSCGYPCVSGHQDFSRDIMRLRIEIALLVIVIGLWFRRVLGFLISVLATMFVEYQYGLWYLDTQRWLREMQVTDFSQLPVPTEWPNFAGLYRATPWDFALLVFFTALFAWQFRILIAFVNARRKKS